jgi:hypothetical protein
MTKHTIQWGGFALPKRGNKADEYEDAFAGAPQVGRFAVADGASESSFAALWAKLLVEGYVRRNEPVTAANWMEPLQKRWAADVDVRDLSWYGEEKRREGAFATFLGMAFKPADEKTGSGRWKAVAVGDSCLFQVRQDHLIAAFPLSRSHDFNQTPALIGSRQSLAKMPKKQEWGKWAPGDRFFLMTDALAQWFLRRNEGKQNPWQSLNRRLAEPKAGELLTAYIEQLRDQKELKNDDVTLVTIIVKQ